MAIEWRPVPGYDGYFVSNNGIIQSHKRKTPINLSYDTKKDGYLRVYLCKHGKVKAFYVHRVVALAFIENPQNLPFINHKDECKTNNNAENLEWCTFKYNINYGTAIKRRVEHTNHKANAAKIDWYKVLKKRQGPRKYKAVQQLKDGKVVATFQSTSEAARKTGLWQQAISLACRGKLKQTGGYQWSFIKEEI